jgi:hypothetical protein
MPKKTSKTEVVIPFSDNFTPIWELWKEYKDEAFGFKYKSGISEQMALKKLVQLSGGHEDVAIAIIEQSMADQWEGLFPLKNNNTPNGQKQRAGTDTQRQSLNDALNKRFGNGQQN